MRARTLKFLCAVSLIGALSTGPTIAQQQDAYNDGLSTGKVLAGEAEDLPLRDPTPDNLPGYQDAPSDLKDLYDAQDDTGLNSAATGAAGTEPWQIMQGSVHNEARIDRSLLDDIRERGEEINADPSAYALGITADGEQGKCEAITSPGAPKMYEATCDVGDAVVESHPSCEITLNHNLSQETDYRCTSVTLNGQLCSREDLWGGVVTQCFNYSDEKSSGCGAFVNAGCSLTGSGVIDSIPVSESGVRSASLVVKEFDYRCAVPVSPTISGSPYVVSGVSYFAEAAAVGSSAGYFGSTKNYSMCSDRELVGCPTGFVMEGTRCVQRIPATLTYVCEDGWSLSGATCTQVVTQLAAPEGLTCPAGFSLVGETCEGVVDATPAYSCSAGWTLVGTMCERPYSRPAIRPGAVRRGGPCRDRRVRGQ